MKVLVFFLETLLFAKNCILYLEQVINKTSFNKNSKNKF
jgi:hypothetical protein